MRAPTILIRIAAAIFALASVPIAWAEPMTFHVKNDEASRLAAILMRGGERVIYAEGDLETGTAQRFLDFIKANRIELALVSLNSPGGSLGEGIKLGRVIRILGFSTSISALNDNYELSSAICASACAYAFAGGVSRYLTESSGRLGIHQFYAGPGDTMSGQEAQEVSGMIVAYLDEMGIDAKAFTISTVADAEGMVWLTPQDAKNLRFSNNGIMPATAEIKIYEMTPYLKLEQEHADGTARVLLFCEGRKIEMSFGIVTSEDVVLFGGYGVKRSYLELDGKEQSAISGADGFKKDKATHWVARSLTAPDVAKLLTTDELGGWLDSFGAMRWGMTIDLTDVREPLRNYVAQCYRG